MSKKPNKLKIEFFTSADGYAQIRIDPTDVWAEDNLRRSEAQELAKRALSKMIEAMELPKELKVSAPSLEDWTVEGRENDGKKLAVSVTVTDSKRYIKNWNSFIFPAFDKGKEAALKDIGKPEVHDPEGNVVSGSHAARAAASKSTGGRGRGSEGKKPAH
jgi:hypothetical protein